MKQTSFLTAGLVLATLHSYCQPSIVNEPNYNRPKLFQALPSQVPVSMVNLNRLFDAQAGQHLEINLSDSVSFRFEGDINTVVNKYDDRIKTVVMRSVNYPGANLTVSRITDASGLFSYQGRIVSFGHGDLFQLQVINGNYVLIKKGYYDLVNE